MLTVSMERETGIEPASLAWKAKVLPLNYSRSALKGAGGGGWIRTSVGVNRQIYSLLPLTTRPPLREGRKRAIMPQPRPGGKRRSAFAGGKVCMLATGGHSPSPTVRADARRGRGTVFSCAIQHTTTNYAAVLAYSAGNHTILMQFKL